MVVNFGLPGPGGGFYCALLLFVLLLWLFPLMVLSDYGGLTRAEIKKELQEHRTNRKHSISDAKLEEIVECADKGDCAGKFQRNFIINEIIIRMNFLSHGKVCRLFFGRMILDPPNTIGEDNSKYLYWQGRILKYFETDKNSLCDPFQNLYCPEIKLKCECITPSKWSTAESKCVINIGESCKFDKHVHVYRDIYKDVHPRTDVDAYKIHPDHPSFYVDTLFPWQIPKYYDPLSTLLDYFVEEITVPECGVVPSPGKSCSKLSYFGDDSKCLHSSITTSADELKKYFDDVIIKEDYGKKCNFDDHKNLYTITDAEKDDFTIRHTTLKNIREKGNSICDLKKFLTCGKTNKCECIFPATFDNNTQKCIILPPYDKCGEGIKNSTLGNKNLIEEAKMSIGQAIEHQLWNTSCGGNLFCYFDSSDMNNMDMYCTCPNGKTGKNCDKPLTKFLTRVRPGVFPIDEPNPDIKVEIYDKLNEAALNFENIFTLKEDSQCDFEEQFKLDYRVLRLRKLDKSSTVNLTRMDYLSLTSEIINLTKINHNKSACNSIEQHACVSTSDWANMCDVIINKIDFHYQFKTFAFHRYKSLTCDKTCDPDFEKNIYNLMNVDSHADFDLIYEQLINIWVLTKKFNLCERGLSCIKGNDTLGKCSCPIIYPPSPEREWNPHGNGGPGYGTFINGYNNILITITIPLIIFF